MTFTTSPAPLFLPSWTPATPAAYAAACLSLVALSFLHRALLVVVVAHRQTLFSFHGERGAPRAGGYHSLEPHDSRHHHHHHLFLKEEGGEWGPAEPVTIVSPRRRLGQAAAVASARTRHDRLSIFGIFGETARALVETAVVATGYLV
jgi:hypothetical protein